MGDAPVLGLLSQREGVLLLKGIGPKSSPTDQIISNKLIDSKAMGTESVCMLSLESIKNGSFYLAQAVNYVNTEDVERAKRGEKLGILKQTFQLTQAYAKSTSKGQLIVKKRDVMFQVDISQGMYREREPNLEDGSTYVQEFFLTSFPSSLKAIFAINFQNSFEVYMIDPRVSQKQINLRKALDIELLTTTRNAQIY